MHLPEAAMTASTRYFDTSMSIAPKELIASTMRPLPWRSHAAAISGSGLSVPAPVSQCTCATCVMAGSFAKAASRIAALDQFKAEGGQPARGERYRRNCETLVEGMAALGFRPFLPKAVQAPIIVTFHAPADPAYEFKSFYEKVRSRGYVLYPGKLTRVETFRVGCIGAIDANEMRNVVAAVGDTLREMGVRQVAPKAEAVAA